ncbi:melanocyte-stimulating hormone receptor-like [Oculina patagonica]
MPTATSASTRDPFYENSSSFLGHVFIDFVIATPAILSNAVLLVTIYRDSRQQLKLLWATPVTLLVTNLCVCDLLAGVLLGCGSLYYDFTVLASRANEQLLTEIKRTVIMLTTTGITTFVVGSCTVMAMSFDRLIAIRSPLRYKTQVTKTKIKVFIASVWIYTLLFASLSRMGVPREIFILLYCHLHLSLPLIILAVVYWQTYRALCLHSNRVRDLASGDELMNEAHRNRERKVLSAIVFVLGLFYITFAPQFVALNMLFFQPWLRKVGSFRAFLYTSNKVLLVSSSINPFIYAWRIPKYRSALKAVFRKSDLPNPIDSNIPLRNISAGESHTAEPEIRHNAIINDTIINDI